MIARAAEAEAAGQSSESDPADRQIDIDELRRATTNVIWHLRLHSLERWFPSPRPTEEGSLFWTVLHERFYLAYFASRMTLFLHHVLVIPLLTRAIDMPQDQLQRYFSYLQGLQFVLTLPRHYHEGWFRVFYATVWIDPLHRFIRYMFKGKSHQIERADLDTRLHELAYPEASPPLPQGSSLST